MLRRRVEYLQREHVHLSNHFVGSVLSRDRARPDTIEPGTLLSYFVLYVSLRGARRILLLNCFLHVSLLRARHILILLFTY